ncbi:MAG TPA: hypothetical protein VFA43_05185 [Gemmatimonadaceae bacterium]|nr:hypothetical protein [Gemmatimonadaceae bacterium]
MRRLFAAGVLGAIAWSALAAQEEAPDPHAAQPERPTVATHAGTVYPGWVEVEAGAQRSESDGVLAIETPVVTKLGVVSHVQLSLYQVWQSQNGNGAHDQGLGDVAVGVKWRLLDDAPVVGDFALLPILKLSTGAGGTSTSTTDLTLLLISSHEFGPLSLDVNVGYTHRTGSGTSAPRTATLWTVSAGLQVVGSFGWTGEISGLPGTSGPAGQAPIVALLTGPTWTARKWLVFDAGVSPTLRGPQATYVYAGVTCNVGRLW